MFLRAFNIEYAPYFIPCFIRVQPLLIPYCMLDQPKGLWNTRLDPQHC